MKRTYTDTVINKQEYMISNQSEDGPMYKIRLEKVEEIGNSTRMYTFEKPDTLTWTEGSHTHLAHVDFMADGFMDKSLVRHMSIHSIPEEGYIGVTTRVPGSMSKYKQFLDDMVTGTEMFIFKTQNHMPLRREDKSIVLISMGVGISAVRPYVKSFLNNSEGIKGVTSINIDRNHYVYEDEFKSINHENFECVYTDSRSVLFEKIDKTIHLSESLFYIIGSESFIFEVSSHLLKRGVYKGDIMIDKNEHKRADYEL